MICDLANARSALARAEWERARRAFEAALTAVETAEALEGLAAAAWWQDDAEVVIASRERAYKLYRERGDSRGAARVATALAEDHAYFRGELAVTSGWFRRARSLLSELELIPEHGWLELYEADVAFCLGGDPERGRSLALKAISVGRDLGDVDIEMMGLALDGLGLVYLGRPADGLPRIDEAITAALAGEMKDYYAIGCAYCYMIQACERVRDYERAGQWFERSQQFAREIRFEFLYAVCRALHSAVLIWRGDWQQAETELQASRRELGRSRPPIQLEATVRLAQLRRLQGRYGEVEELLNEAQEHPFSLVERSALALERGDQASAVRFAERFLRRCHPVDLTARLFGLEVLLRARLAMGNIEGAREAADELRQIGEPIGTYAVRASVLVAEGLLLAAAGDKERARIALEDAVDLYRQARATLETGRARLELARILADLALSEEAAAEARGALEAFLPLGATTAAEAAERLLASADKPQLRHAPLTPREVDVLRLVASGVTNPGIARRLKLSEFTIKRHIANILTKLDLPNRAAAAVYAVREKLL
jgi:LuxR family transcriptional regulator, maltose regulon positive regulatory protein